MEKITSGKSTPEEFITFINSQEKIEDLKELEWSQQPLWKVFLSTDPNDKEMHNFLLAYQELGGDFNELDQYKKNVLYFRLERAKNSYALDLQTLLQTFELAGNMAEMENRGKAFWEYCIKNDWEEAEKLTAITRFHELGGDCQLQGEYGSIFKYIAEVPSIQLWKLVASWMEVVVDDEFVVGGEGAERIAFCEFLAEQQIPMAHWGGITMDYALRDEDWELFDKLIALGWELDLQDADLYRRVRDIDAYRRLIALGVSLHPESTYPGDFPVYSTIYNLRGRIEQYNESQDDYYLESVNEDKEILKLLLQNGARLDMPLVYDEYPPLAVMLQTFPEIYELVQAEADANSLEFLAREIEDLDD